MLRYTPMTEVNIFLPRAVRPEVKKYLPRSEVYHLSIYTEKEVRLPHNFATHKHFFFLPPPLPLQLQSKLQKYTFVASFHTYRFKILHRGTGYLMGFYGNDLMCSCHYLQLWYFLYL